MLLRALAGHPMIRVAHDLKAKNTRTEQLLVGRVRYGGAVTIAADDPLLGNDRPPEGGIVVVKNAVWTPDYPCPSIVLSRNPFSVAMSIGALEVAAWEAKLANSLRYRYGRHLGMKTERPAIVEDVREKLDRWSRGIDIRMTQYVNRTDAVTGTAALYQRKMLNAWDSGGPILRYETFVRDPEAPLRKLIAHLGLPWDDMVLRAHERYAEGEIGHGGIRLWEPIHDKSQDKYKSMPLTEFNKIYAITASVMEKFGYAAAPERNLIVNEDFDDRFGSGTGDRVLPRLAAAQ